MLRYQEKNLFAIWSKEVICGYVSIFTESFIRQN